MRPTTLADMVGQEHIISAGKPLRRMIETDRIVSLVFFGPPGTGKSTLAHIIAESTKSEYIRINAVLSNVAELRASLRHGEENARRGKKTILFIDEIHRFNKSQQDALLPAIEAGTVILIGSTTQNPYFYLTNALLSRVMLFPFKAIEDEAIERFVRSALADTRGFSGTVTITDSAVKLIVSSALGDIRKALTYLEFAVLASGMNDEAAEAVTDDIVREVVQQKALRYDRDGDEHYDTASAFIKSVRGSDPDAALYYLAVMLESGDDPRFIARRLSILAAEDIGLADPSALSVAASAFTIVELIGMPEAALVLSECTIYLALAPKSNSATIAVGKAMADVKAGNVSPVPNYLRDSHSSVFDRKDPEGYRYPHNFPHHIVAQAYTTDAKKYYEPQDMGFEKELKKRHEWIIRHIAPEKKGADAGGG
ncbi:MAG: replication-associated recombination protein A [Spirochaetes bacterium]|nr:replication-associated recombination protein A [Spirochaetota bacterium]